MLDTISDLEYKKFLSSIMNITLNLRTSNSEEDTAFNRIQFEKLDLLLGIAIPLVSVQPVLVTIGYLRSTFRLKNVLPNWILLLEAAENAFEEKFKSEKAKSLLRGLRTDI
jgi:hypothetical protein